MNADASPNAMPRSPNGRWQIFGALGVAGTAAFVGNMLTIGLGFGGYWQSLEPAAFLTWFETNFFRFLIPTVSSVLPFSLIGLAGAVRLSQHKATRKLWAMALGCVVIACVITAAYHLPTNLAFVSGSMTPAEASAALSTWMLLHWVRVAFAIAATVLALKAFRSQDRDA